MANRRSKMVGLGLAAATAWGAWTVGSKLLGDDAETEGTRFVVNQVWLERLPTNDRDMIGHLALIKHPEGRVGIAGRSSNWRHFIEAYLWKLKGNSLELFFPQDEVHGKVEVKTYDCKGSAPAPFEICMDIKARNRSVTYYSKREWKIEPRNAADSLDALAEDFPRLAEQIGSELSGEITTRVVDIDTVDWAETDALPLP